MMIVGEILALWLMPALPARERFDRLIKELAQRFDAPVFEPHVTLYVAAFDAQSRFEALDTLILPEVVQLEAQGVDFSEEFTRTLFVQFNPTAQLNMLSAAVGRALRKASDYKIDPHLSLLYQNLPTAEKAELARTIALPNEAVPFDALKAIVSPAKISTRAHVESWRTVWEQRL